MWLKILRTLQCVNKERYWYVTKFIFFQLKGKEKGSLTKKEPTPAF